jgi:hypothetical protein
MSKKKQSGIVPFKMKPESELMNPFRVRPIFARQVRRAIKASGLNYSDFMRQLLSDYLIRQEELKKHG